jgi:formate dehydrogenase iron-sulfur subunit
MCSTKALLGGDGDVLANIYRERVTHRGVGGEIWGWATAYKLPGNTPAVKGIPASPNLPRTPGNTAPPGPSAGGGTRS